MISTRMETCGSLIRRTGKSSTCGRPLDTCSGNIVYTDEAVAECNAFLSSKKAYVGTDGKFINDTSVATINYVLKNITGRKKYTDIAP